VRMGDALGLYKALHPRGPMHRARDPFQHDPRSAAVGPEPTSACAEFVMALGAGRQRRSHDVAVHAGRRDRMVGGPQTPGAFCANIELSCDACR
jgi:hypothetical protein